MARLTHSRVTPGLVLCTLLSVGGSLFADEPPDQVWEGGIRGAAAAASSIKVLTWNIERGLRLPEVTEVLLRHGPALLLLQEVDVNARRTGRRNIAEELARSLRMPYLFAAEFEELGQGAHDSPAYHGQAILTTLPASSARIIRFKQQTSFWRPRPYMPDWPAFQRRKGGRLALVSEVDVAGRRLVVYNAHLESRESEQLRKAQLDEILADTRRYPADTPILIAGDFNTRTAASPVIDALLKAGFQMAAGGEVTTARGLALDWIFVRGAQRSEQGMIHSDTKASDHFPLTVVVHFNPL
jgi:endonuclease/exonuclease/phosphatase family metal-dependent hydrolase